MLIRAHRGGFTLIEIMLSTATMLLVGGAVHRLLHTTQRLARRQAQQVSLQSGLRAGSLLLANELRELSPADLISAGSSGLVYRAMRGLGFLCRPAGNTELRISRAEFSGHRDPQPGRDSVYGFLAAGADTPTHNVWLLLPVTRVAPAPCPTGGPGIALTVPSTGGLAGAPAGTPVRIFELMELKLYRSEGKSWLGLRSASAGETVQPVMGPLSDGGGLVLEYLDRDGRTTGDMSAVRSVRITLRGISEAAPGAGLGTRLEDQLSSEVALRNSSAP